MAIMSSYQEVVLQHQMKLFLVLSLLVSSMLSILKDENLNGMEARKKLSQVYDKSLKIIHKELRLQSAQMEV